MYNGIGLQTPRGSGTNGYVTRNMSFVPKSREKVNYKTEEDIKKLDALSNKKPNQGILAHERKRAIELKCLEMQELMEEQGYSDAEIDAKVALFRKMLMEKEGVGEKEIPRDEFGRPVVKESHQIAEANQEKNAKMREALGISPFFIEGSSLDPERKAKEAVAAAAEEAKKKYTLIPDSSSDSTPEKSQEKEKNKKRKKKKSHNSGEKVEAASKKKKNAKKHKKDRSTHKKHRSSSSSSDSSSDSAGEESSSRSSSRNSVSEVESDVPHKKTKSSSKLDKNHKERRKRSSSSESIRYSKDSRSRKDIYEAKKAKRKRKPSRSSSSSSSSGDSSPKQYFRLEPVLLKSKSKHKKGHQIIEIPKNNAFELKKYDKKKRSRHTSSSSDEEEVAKHDSKKRKRSSSPVAPKISKHHSGREVAKDTKQSSSHKSSRSEKEIYRSTPEKHCRKKSRSSDSRHTSQNHTARSISQDDGEGTSRKKKEHLIEENERHSGKSSKGKQKHDRNVSHSPKRNGLSKHATRSYTPESDVSKNSIRSSSSKHKKRVPKSPSDSPPVYKHKKHVIQSPDYAPSHSSNKKKSRKSPSVSPPKKEKYERSRKLSSDSSPDQSSKKRIRSHRSHSAVSDSKHVKKDHRRAFLSPKEAASSPGKKKPSKDSRSRSPSLPHKKTSSKHRNTSSNHRSPSLESDEINNRHITKIRGSKEEKNGNCRSRSRSPTHQSKKNADAKREKVHPSSISPVLNKSRGQSSKETKQSSPSRNVIHHKYRDSHSASPDQTVKKDSKRQKSSKSPSIETQTIKIVTNKETLVSTEESPKHDKLSYSEKLSNPPSDFHNVESTTPITEVYEESSDRNKGKWVIVSNGDHSTSALPNHSSVEVPLSKNSHKCLPLQLKEGENTRDSDKQNLAESQEHLSGKNEKTTKISPRRSGSITKVSDHEKKDFTKDRKTKKSSHSRSRSVSISRSCSVSGSDRSSRSRSRSYSKSRSKSYSKSRSKSYSKSRSHSRSHSHRDSRSRSHSRSCSKSYSRSRSGSVSICSRSRSRSYSSRSRSRSIARSPSIPRRRGSPSFLDKRRITSARKRPVPYRRPSPPTPSSTSSWSYHTFSRSSSPLHPTIHSPASVCSSRSFRSRSHSWSPVLKQKYELTLNSALR